MPGLERRQLRSDDMDISKLAEDADKHADQKLGIGEYHPDWHDVRDEYFAMKVAEAEREACAVTSENFSTRDGYEIAHKIRMRSNLN